MVKKYALLITCILAAQNSFAANVAGKQYSDVTQFMHSLAQSHPNIVKKIIVGPSNSGQEIEGVAIGDGPVHNLIVATHHGNEYGSTEVSMAFAASLADKPIPGQTVYVIPVLNIDGFNKKQREEKSANGSSHDPNRDYPGPCGTEGPHALKSTASLAKFIDQENIVNSATLHTYFPAVVYPWGLPTHDTVTAYDHIFTAMGKNATELSHYTVGNTTEVIYPALGSYEDYAFWKSGVWSMLFELGYSHSPSQENIDEMNRVNVPGLRKMLEQAPTERAVNHEFAGRCDASMKKLDKHDE